MSDYISREAAVKIAQKCGLVNGSVLGRHTGLADCIAIEIEGLPAADLEPVRHGRWEHKKNDYSVAWCSKCKGLFDTTWHGKTAKEYFAKFVEAYRYCPRCGAKMDLEDETNDN